MPSLALTKTAIECCMPPEGKVKIDLFDTVCRCLMIEIRASGRKTYYFRYTDGRGKQRQVRIGLYGEVSLDQARKLVAKYKNQQILGADPFEEKEIRKQVPQFEEFINSCYLPYIKTYKRSWACDVSILNNHLLPRLGKKYLDEITLQDILKIHNERSEAGAAPGSINRMVVLIRYIYNLAIKWNTPGVKDNPSKSIPMMEENNKKERYLTQPEAVRLYEAVRSSENLMLKHIVPMLILTGARKREVLDAKWVDFDVVRKVWRIPISKSGKSRHIPLSEGALHILEQLPKIDGCEFPFANPTTKRPYANIFESWNTARCRAGLADVRLHDLRHSFASLLINQGRTLYEVQNLLGHTQVKTTQRYAHLSHDTLLDAANVATRAMAGVMLPVNRFSGIETAYPIQFDLSSKNHAHTFPPK